MDNPMEPWWVVKTHCIRAGRIADRLATQEGLDRQAAIAFVTLRIDQRRGHYPVRARSGNLSTALSGGSSQDRHGDRRDGRRLCRVRRALSTNLCPAWCEADRSAHPRFDREPVAVARRGVGDYHLLFPRRPRAPAAISEPRFAGDHILRAGVDLLPPGARASRRTQAIARHARLDRTTRKWHARSFARIAGAERRQRP